VAYDPIRAFNSPKRRKKTTISRRRAFLALYYALPRVLYYEEDRLSPITAAYLAYYAASRYRVFFAS
jgi:hypothetical protein